MELMMYVDTCIVCKVSLFMLLPSSGDCFYVESWSDRCSTIVAFIDCDFMGCFSEKYEVQKYESNPTAIYM